MYTEAAIAMDGWMMMIADLIIIREKLSPHRGQFG